MLHFSDLQDKLKPAVETLTEKVKAFDVQTLKEKVKVFDRMTLYRMLAVVVLVVVAIMSVSACGSPKDAEAVVEPEPVYVAETDGEDKIVYADGTVASGYAFDKKGNIVSQEDGEVYVKAKDIERAVVIEVEVTPEPVTAAPINLNPPEKEKDEFPFRASISKAGVRLRSLPTTEARILKEFTEGEQVEVIESDADWYKVQSGDMVGYVKNSYVLKING